MEPPSRGIMSRFPLEDLIEVFFRISGKFVRGNTSITPQSASLVSPTILKPNDLRTLLWAPSHPYVLLVVELVMLHIEMRLNIPGDIWLGSLLCHHYDSQLQL